MTTFRIPPKRVSRTKPAPDLTRKAEVFYSPHVPWDCHVLENPTGPAPTSRLRTPLGRYFDDGSPGSSTPWGGAASAASARAPGQVGPPRAENFLAAGARLRSVLAPPAHELGAQQDDPGHHQTAQDGGDRRPGRVLLGRQRGELGDDAEVVLGLRLLVA